MKNAVNDSSFLSAPDLSSIRLVPKSVAVVDEQVGSAANFDGEEAPGLDSAGLHQHTQHQRHAAGAGDESDSGHDGMYVRFFPRRAPFLLLAFV